MIDPEQKLTWTPPRRFELSARRTKGGNQNLPVPEGYLGMTFCYPDDGTTTPTGPTGS